MKNEKENEKKLVDKTIFQKTGTKPFQWKDIKNVDLQDDDYIISQYIEPYYSENNSWDGHYSIEIHRDVLETDEEYFKRIKRLEEDKKMLKQRRYETYLKLKKEFEK